MACVATGRRPSLAAFTLVELLVVISVIALLIAILLPALSAARATATNIACLSNVRQLYIAQRVYGNDNRDYIPPRLRTNNVDSYWTNRLWDNDYLPRAADTNSAFYCPADDALRFVSPTGGRSSYAQNGHISDGFTASEAARRFDEIREPEDVALTFDRVPGSVIGRVNPATLHVLSYWGHDGGGMADRHGQPGYTSATTTNVSFVAGHAEVVPFIHPSHIPTGHNNSGIPRNYFWYSVWIHENPWW